MFNRQLIKRENVTNKTMGKLFLMGFNGLSNKQEKFINLHVIDGLNITDAYREAYDTKTSNQNTLYNQPSILASNPKVSLRIK